MAVSRSNTSGPRSGSITAAMATRQEQRLETRRRIYESALAIFRRDGVGPCRTDDIATAAGVSRGAFYFHFPTKEHVMLERMRETEQIICGQIDAMAKDAPIDSVLAVLNRALASISSRRAGIVVRPEL